MGMRQPPEPEAPAPQNAATDTAPMGDAEAAPNGAPSGAAPDSFKLEVTKLTDVGRVRTHNEDYVDYYSPQDPEQRERKGILCLVADGMGGHQAGEVASQEAVGLVIGQYYGDMTPDVGKSLVRAIQAANRSVFEQSQADASKAGMGTTLVAAAILGRKVYVANVGDSRAYIIGRGGTSQITEDHSWVEEQVRAGLLTPDQARRHPQRNLVTRALGTRPSVEVDLFEGTMGEEDVLLLCSDGLTNQVQDRDLESAVAELPPERATRELVELAKERGGSDNITVLIVSSQGEAAPAVPVAATPPAQKAAVLILAAVAALLVVAVIALLVIRPLFGGQEETATATATAAAPLAPTATFGEVILPSPSLTPSQEPTAAGTEEVTPTEALTPGAPTATLRPTVEDTPTPSATTTLAPSLTPAASPRPTDTPALAKPTLREPQEVDARSLRGDVTFRWTYPDPLTIGQAFQVLIWPVGTTERLGAAEPVRLTQQTIDLDELLPERGGPGEYNWSVVVVRSAQPETRLSPEADPWVLNYLGPRDSRPRTPGPEPPPQVTPTNPLPVLPTP